MPYPICRHIHIHGVRCQSPAVLENAFCYFHARFHLSHKTNLAPVTEAVYRSGARSLELAPIEDFESVQLALSTIVVALAEGRMDIQRAKTLFYGLQLSSANVGRLKRNLTLAEAVRDVGATEEGPEVALSPDDRPDVAEVCRNNKAAHRAARANGNPVDGNAAGD